MKKAKIMLMAISILGVVGGIFAFRAHHFTAEIFYSYTVTGGRPGCLGPVFTSFVTTSQFAPHTSLTILSATTNTTARANTQCNTPFATTSGAE